MRTKAEKAAYQKAWRERQSKDWWDKNRKYMKDWREAQPPDITEALLERRKQHYRDNKEHQLALCRIRLTNIRSNPELLELHLEQRRLYKRSRIRGITLTQWIDLLLMSEFKCAYCGQEFNEDRLPEADHVVPVSQGGDKSILNIVPSCRVCNLKKGKKSLAQFLREMRSGMVA